MNKTNYSIFDNMLEGVQVINKDYKYIYLNDAITQHGKMSKEALLGHSMMEMYPGIENTEMFKYLRKCMEQREPFQMFNEFTYNDGSIGWFDLRMRPIEEGVLIFSFDITQQKQLEIRLKQFNDELEDRVKERTQKLTECLNRERELNELKSVFVSMASHELRTPLTTILSSVSLAQQYTDISQTDKREKHLARIKASVGHLTCILNDFLSLSKLESGKEEYKPSKINLQEYVPELLEDLQPICKENQVIKYFHEGLTTEVYIDKNIIKNVIFNLISNAIKYSNQNIDFITKITDNTLTIQIIDRGIGIPEQDKNKIFEKFFRATNSTTIQGTGLGLNIVKKYIDLAGGSIHFESNVNTGSIFTVVLPQKISWCG